MPPSPSLSLPRLLKRPPPNLPPKPLLPKSLWLLFASQHQLREVPSGTILPESSSVLRSCKMIGRTPRWTQSGSAQLTIASIGMQMMVSTATSNGIYGWLTASRIGMICVRASKINGTIRMLTGRPQLRLMQNAGTRMLMLNQKGVQLNGKHSEFSAGTTMTNRIHICGTKTAMCYSTGFLKIGMKKNGWPLASSA